jgi:predicted dehydrogenase
VLRAAVIGLGPIGTTHATCLEQLGGVELACVVDADESRLQGRQVGLTATALANIEGLPDDVDLVTVAVPPAAHYRVVEELLERGFHVFCEKPLTLKLTEAEALAKLAQDQHRLLGVGFKMRYEPWFVKARKLIERIGPPYQVITTKVQAFGGKDWVTTTGAMQELSSHDFDLIHHIAGVRPRRMLSADLSRRRGWPAEDGFALVVEYDSGMLGSLNGWYCDSFAWDGRDSTMRFIGPQGYLSIDRFERVVVHTDVEEVFTFETAPNTFLLELEAFLRAIDTGSSDYPDAGAGIDSLWIVEEAYRVASSSPRN